MTVDVTEAKVAAEFEYAIGVIIRHLARSGVIVVASVGSIRTTMVVKRSGDVEHKVTTEMGFPARLPTVISVGSDSAEDRNFSKEAGRHLVVYGIRTRPLCTWDGQPFGGSSAATAYVSRQLCADLAIKDPTQQAAVRASEVLDDFPWASLENRSHRIYG